MFWQVTLNDIRVKIKLHLGHQQAQIVQNFQTLSKVVSLAFGDGKGGKERPPEVQNKAELTSKFNAIFGSR